MFYLQNTLFHLPSTSSSTEGEVKDEPTEDVARMGVVWWLLSLHQVLQLQPCNTLNLLSVGEGNDWKSDRTGSRREGVTRPKSREHYHKDNLRHLPRFPGFFVTFRILVSSFPSVHVSLLLCSPPNLVSHAPRSPFTFGSRPLRGDGSGMEWGPRDRTRPSPEERERQEQLEDFQILH